MGIGEPDGKHESLKIEAFLLIQKGKFRYFLYVTISVLLLNITTWNSYDYGAEKHKTEKVISVQTSLGFDCYYFHFV